MVDQEVLKHHKNTRLISDRLASAQTLQKRKVNKWDTSKYSTITKTEGFKNDRSVSAQVLWKRKINK